MSIGFDAASTNPGASGALMRDPALDQISFNADGLVPVVVQQWDSGEVLMMAWADREAVARTLDTREATYFSRSRGEQWVKGATSGHTQAVHEVRLDCDGDTLLYRVDQRGAACHTGDRTCFDAAVLLSPAVMVGHGSESSGA